MEMQLAELQVRADQGDMNAQYELAMAYIYGNGVEEDNEKAAALLEAAAEQGHREAAYNLGVCYHYGHGVEKDLKTAYQLYLRSGLQGYGKGLNLVGDFYAEGLGVRQSWREAIKWYLDATVSDDLAAVGYAEYKLAGILARGNGVEQDLDAAAEWYEKALSHGEERAGVELEKLGGASALRVREARPEDAAAIWRLSVQRLNCECELEDLQERLTRLLEQDLIYVATVQGKVQGFAHAGTLERLQEPPCRLLLSLAAVKGDAAVEEALVQKLRAEAEKAGMPLKLSADET